MTDDKAPLPADEMCSVCILDFPGFYESQLSAVIDWEIERVAEHEDEKQANAEYYPDEYQPTPLRVATGEILWEHVDYPKAYEATARAYVDALNDRAADLSADLPPLRLIFECIDSPRYYNFDTDRLFVRMPRETLAELFAYSAAGGHVMLDAVLRERFTSRSGFQSFYPADLRSWLAKPLAEWDANENGALLLACLRDAGSPDGLTEDCCGYCNEASGANGDIDAATNWWAFEAAVEAEREKQLAEWRVADPVAAANWLARIPGEPTLPGV